MQNTRPPYRVLLSFDLEEFDIPNEYGATLPVQEQLETTALGLARLSPLLADLQLPATFFTTAFYAQQEPAAVKALAAGNEIASHSFYHSRFTEDDILSSRQVLSQISGQSIAGFRMPRLAPVDKRLIATAGYQYDASLNPTWLPGRYNYLQEPRTLFTKNGLFILPSSVTPLLRLPLFWISFKNMPLALVKHWSLQTLKKDGYLSLYFHPWEYADLRAYTQMPFYTRHSCGLQLLEKMHIYLQWLKSIAHFGTMHNFIQEQTAHDLQ